MCKSLVDIKLLLYDKYVIIFSCYRCINNKFMGHYIMVIYQNGFIEKTVVM